MVITIDEIERYIGLEVKDPYGRKVGRIVAVYSEVDGSVTGIELEVNEDTFTTIRANRIQITEDGELHIIPEWKAEALEIIKQLDRAKKRAKALDDLYSRNEIPRHAYDEFKKRVEESLKSLKVKAREVKARLRRRTHDLEDIILQIERAMAAIRMSYLAGEITEKGYKAAIEALRQAKDKASEEKEDIKKIKEKIEKLESGPAEIISTMRKTVTEAPTEKSEASIPEAPILVQVVEG